MIRRTDLYSAFAALTAIRNSLISPEGTPMTIDSTFVDAIEKLADDYDDRELVDSSITPSGSVSVHRVPNSDNVHTLDLEKYLAAPRRPRGDTVVHDPADFAGYVDRVHGPATTVWADQATRKVTAVVNDAEPRDGDTDGLDGGGAFGWRDHTVSLALQVDPEWEAWLALNNTMVTQQKMVEHLERFGDNVVDPEAAAMRDLAAELRATRSAEFESSYRDKTGDIVVKYSQTTKVHRGEKGEVEVPDHIVIRVAPYLGFPPVDLKGSFLVRIAGEDDQRPGSMSIGYRLIRPDLVLREAFDQVVGQIDAALPDDVPVYRGAAPRPIAADVRI